jgi:putative hydrolase of the HAD superfamily
MEPGQARAVLFDLDDTLTDRPASLRRFAGAFAQAYRGRLRDVDVDELDRQIQAADRHGGGRAASPSGPDRHDRDVAAVLARALPWVDRPSVDELAAFWTARLPACSEPMDGLHELLAGLRERGWRVGIVTNGAVARQEPKVAALGLGACLDCLVVSEAVGAQKPDRRIFALALERVGVSAARAWYVGDNPVNDVLGASAAGLSAVWLRRGPWPAAQARPVHAIDALAELMPILERAGPA